MDNEALDRMTMALMGASPTDEAQMDSLDTQPVIQILPDANVIKIGGQSFIDRGRAAVFPLIEEIVENLPRHKMIIGTGAGTRARHAYSVGLDLGMPTGVLSVLGFFVSIQNAKMIHYLLAKYGIPSIEPAQFAQLPLYLAERLSERVGHRVEHLEVYPEAALFQHFADYCGLHLKSLRGNQS